MAVQWHYGCGSDISGPVSDAELAALVASGNLLRTDTVWQDDAEEGVPAGTVKDLFELLTQPVDPEEVDIPASLAIPVPEEVAVPPPYVPQSRPVSTARATAGKGAIIVGQDGKTVKFRLKCTVCGHEDSSWKTIAIPRGIARASFHCRKCRKLREGEINGFR